MLQTIVVPSNLVLLLDSKNIQQTIQILFAIVKTSLLKIVKTMIKISIESILIKKTSNAQKTSIAQYLDKITDNPWKFASIVGIEYTDNTDNTDNTNAAHLLQMNKVVVHVLTNLYGQLMFMKNETVYQDILIAISKLKIFVGKLEKQNLTNLDLPPCFKQITREHESKKFSIWYIPELKNNCTSINTSLINLPSDCLFHIFSYNSIELKDIVNYGRLCKTTLGRNTDILKSLPCNDNFIELVERILLEDNDTQFQNVFGSIIINRETEREKFNVIRLAMRKHWDAFNCWSVFI